MRTIFVTLGDPTGIGPEVILKALAPAYRLESSRSPSWQIIGSGEVLQATYDRLCPHLPPNTLAKSVPASAISSLDP